MPKYKNKKKDTNEKKECKEKDEPIDYMNKPVYEMDDDELNELLDNKWYPRANDFLWKQRKIWDYSYLSYKGIMLWDEVNRKRRNNGYGMYVNVPRTYATIEGIRKNFNISKLKINVLDQPGVKMGEKRYKVNEFLNYDLDRSKTRDQIKDSAFDKLVYGNGFLYSFLINKKGYYGEIGSGDIDEKTGRVPVITSKEKKTKYYGMAARRVPVQNVLPDPDGSHLDVNDHVNPMCKYVCIRTCKHISSFRRDWRGIVPDKILDDVKPGGKDLTNYEAVKSSVDYLFDYNALRYPGTVQDFVSSNKISFQYDKKDYVEERLWLGEDFIVLRAGANQKTCLVSCNPNPEKRYPLKKMDDVSVPGEFWSMGEPYIMRYQQVEENRIHNSVLDLIHYSVSGMLGINSNYLEDGFDTEQYPGKVWKFKAMPGTKISDVMQGFQPSTAAIAPAMKFMDEVKSVGQQTTSITDFVMGASESIADTATESKQLASASSLTIVEKIRETVAGPMVSICEDWLAQYSTVYEGEKIEKAGIKGNIYFTGKSVKDTSEDEIKKILGDGYEVEDIMFTDDFGISNPKLDVVGDVEINKEAKLGQWTQAIQFGNQVNKIAYETGDPRRLDTVQMGVDAMENFDVISNPKDYLKEDMPTKADDQRSAAMAGAEANAMQQQGAEGGAPPAGGGNVPQAQNGGAPTKPVINKVLSGKEAIRSEAQPGPPSKL